jgi:membrane protein DedA with SNARE-associated domain
MDKVREMFARWGFSTVAVPALMPPPVPLVPFVLAAGAMQYPAKKFLAAMITGRVIRYTVLAYLAGRYGRRILHPGPAIWVAFGILAVAAFLALYLWHEIRSPEPIED